MQEEVENRTVNLAISTTKLTARSLLNAFRAYMNHRRNVKAKKTADNSFYPICCLGPGRYESWRSMAYRKREYSSLPHSRPDGGASCRVF